MTGMIGPYGPEAFAVTTIAVAITFHWARVWLGSGAVLLTYLLLAGENRGHRIFPHFPVAIILATLTLTCAAASTSWLFYWIFAAVCWPECLIVAIYQFGEVGDFTRTRTRGLLRQLQFTADKVAFFDLPALEIDVDVAGLLVIRGVTFSLSSLTLEARGIEVGIKLSDDMELALQTDRVTIALFRSIEVDDVYGNVKGGEYEMTFGKLEVDTRDEEGEALMQDSTPLLRAATTWSSNGSAGGFEHEKIKMTDRMTDGHSPKATSVSKVVDTVIKFSADDAEAAKRYQDTLAEMSATSEINLARKAVNRIAFRRASSTNLADPAAIDMTNEKHVRAAICSELHHKPSIQHPPRRSIKVTTLQNLSGPRTRKFMHRLPMLLRLLLNPIAHFHPIKFSAITVAASGRWVQSLLGQMVFQHYADEASDIRKLRERIFAWLSDANFAFQLADIAATAQIPFFTRHNINCQLNIDDIVAYRTLPQQVQLRQVIRLGGADATFLIPSFLLPHHEHLLPAFEEKEEEEAAAYRKRMQESDNLPKVLQAKSSLEQARKDETNCKISAHIRLPAVFDQEMLNFVAALVKATKIIEFEKAITAADQDPNDEVHGFREFSRVMSASIKEGMKKTAVNAAANDRWIAKLVGKITKKLEAAQGDLGYSGNIPVSLTPYRILAEKESKLLP